MEQEYVLKYYDKKEEKTREFIWITSFKITEKNKEELVYFIQYAHTIRQLLEKGLKHIAELKMSIKEVSATLTQALTQTITNLTEHKKIQLRFEPE